MNRCGILATVALLGILGCDSASTRQAFLHWEVRSCLGLPGGPTPDQLASGKPPLQSPEEIALLEEAKQYACAEYQKIMALYDAGARGGEVEKLAAAGYALSCAQARLGWAKGDANETIAWLGQSVEFAQRWRDAARVAFSTETATLDELDELTDAMDACWHSKTALLRARGALQQLGFDLKDLPKKIDPLHPVPSDCISKPAVNAPKDRASQDNAPDINTLIPMPTDEAPR